MSDSLTYGLKEVFNMLSSGTLATECSHQPGDALGLYREARRELGSHGFYI